MVPLAELPPGSRRIVTVGTRSIGVFNVNGELFAVRNSCPHQGGPLCLGVVDGLATARFRDGARPVVELEREGEILRCPWHAWEFDLRTGEAIFGEGVRVKAYDVEVEQAPEGVETYDVSVDDGMVVVLLA